MVESDILYGCVRFAPTQVLELPVSMRRLSEKSLRLVSLDQPAEKDIQLVGGSPICT